MESGEPRNVDREEYEAEFERKLEHDNSPSVVIPSIESDDPFREEKFDARVATGIMSSFVAIGAAYALNKFRKRGR